MLCIRPRPGRQTYPLAGDRLKRGRAQVEMATRDNAVEVVEVGREVERESMAHDRAVQLDPDGGHLLAARPRAGQPGLTRLGVDAELTQVVDQRLLELLQVFGDPEPDTSRA